MDINLTPKLKERMKSYPRKIGRYNSSELYFINSGKTTPEMWLAQEERKVKDLLNMWSGTNLHKVVQDLLEPKGYEEEKVEYEYNGIILVGKADYLPKDNPNVVWEFKTSEKTMDTAKPWHKSQVKCYCTMFKRDEGIIYQPVQNDKGIFLRDLGHVNRSDIWFEGELQKLLEFHKEVLKLVS
jgi:hypothetical protein